MKKICGLLAALALLVATPARADEIKVMTSGAFTEAYQQLVEQFQKTTRHTVVTMYGASMGGAQDSIPVRLDRGEPVDVVIVIDAALEPLIKKGHVVTASRVQLARSMIGIAVRKGAPRPDISTIAALRQTLLQAKSIAYSASASGTYVSTELFKRLGIADQVKDKARRIESERVGAVVARGDAEIGFQQVSELLPIAGIDYVGLLPAEVQQVSIISAAIATKATAPVCRKGAHRVSRVAGGGSHYPEDRTRTDCSAHPSAMNLRPPLTRARDVGRNHRIPTYSGCLAPCGRATCGGSRHTPRSASRNLAGLSACAENTWSPCLGLAAGPQPPVVDEIEPVLVPLTH